MLQKLNSENPFKMYIHKALPLYMIYLFNFMLRLEATFTDGVHCLTNYDFW